MSSITNVNNGASVVTVGRTTPVSPGIQPASKSIPVVLASDQTAIPVEEQNKVQSEVALSLLGIPRAEVALGIFADVNTYDVNPSEWSSSPEYHIAGHGIKHLPNEAGALVEAPRNETAVLTSKRFFRYQPGRVSAATFGVKSTVSQANFVQNPSIRKFGIYDNFDGYFWETRNNGQQDNFSVVRRSQSLLKAPNAPFGSKGVQLRGANSAGSNIAYDQYDDYRIIGLGASEALTGAEVDFLPKDRQLIQDARFAIINAALKKITDSNPNFYSNLATAINVVGETAATVELKCRRDLDYWLDFYLLDMKWGGDGHTRVNTTNYATALLPNIPTYERPIHASLRNALTGGNTWPTGSGLIGLTGTVTVPGYSPSSLSTNGLARITALTDITTAAFAGSAVATQMSGVSYGSKSAFETILDTKSHYWAYVVSTKTAAGAAITYTATTFGGTSFTADDIKYKCQRDIGYIIDGYKNDIIGGGNAHTKYNMSMYFRGTGMSIYSQVIGGVASALSEIDRHTYLRDLIRADLSDDIGTPNYNFGYNSVTSTAIIKLTALANKVIANFTIENTDSMETGSEPFAGNLIALRDGLLVTHAAVFDPTLLKDQTPIIAQAIGLDAGANLGTANSFVLTSGHVTFGQHVKISWSGASATLGTASAAISKGSVCKVVKVYGPKGNAFTLADEGGVAKAFTIAQAAAAGIGTIYVTTVVPFIFPKEYDPAVYRAALGLASTGAQDGKLPVGMVFPYMYSNTQNLFADTGTLTEKRVGFVNTALDLSVVEGQNLCRTQIDNVNFTPEYINWIKNNVKPEYYGVYDYRVPRSRFSHDALNGKSDLATDADVRVYSDLATGETGTVRPGEKYTIEGIEQNVSSLYEYDFTKVTMLKIEFSWYGAVGALFLAYVPVGNGEARWVRVHHLRASNQLKIASLGNATLPITYTTYGGGDVATLGYSVDENSIDLGYNSTSHSIVKYGASYYIDGGDRGTVRLYSHNNESTVAAYGKQWAVSGSVVTTQTLDGVSTHALLINNTTLTGPTGAGSTVSAKFFMGARLKTNNAADQNIRVIYVSGNYVFLSSAPQGTSGFKLLPDRANTVFGLETKRVILSTREGNAVRNRVQVYPTKLSSANLGDSAVRLRFKKTPKFQTSAAPSGTLKLSAPYTVTPNRIPLAVTQSGTYLVNGESTYGWFRATVGIDKVTVFGRLYKLAESYYFELLESFNGTVVIGSTEFFLSDSRFQADGTTVAATVSTTYITEKEGLSSINITSNTVVPIPNTGINVATIYLQKTGTEQLDLSPYFDYNKEYLSFPLTDQADSLYFAVDSDTGVETANDDISLGVTWEEQ